MYLCCTVHNPFNMQLIENEEHILKTQYLDELKTMNFIGDKALKKMFIDKIQELDALIFSEHIYRNSVYANTEANSFSKMLIISRSNAREAEFNKLKIKFIWLKNKCINIDSKNSINITNARLFPIENLINTKPFNKSIKRYSYICPLHDEKTPSFVLYRQQNKFHCFGCGKRGDAIDFYMYKTNCSFKEAVSYLTL